MPRYMATRQAACDPCRRFKVACDHSRPVCSRCVQSDRPNLCTYRASPFKRRRHEQAVGTSSGNRHRRSTPLLVTPPDADTPQSEHQPNHGHLGPLSHSGIFNEINSSGDFSTGSGPAIATTSSPEDIISCSMDLEYEVEQVAQTLQQLLSRGDFLSLKGLVTFWLARGVNMTVAEPLVQSCVDTVEYWHRCWISERPQPCSALVAHLLHQSRCPLLLDAQSTLSSFLVQLCNANARLETLGIFALAVSRATMDIPFLPPLYQADHARYALRRIATRLGDCVLALCLALDRPNDLQFILQYEHFIVHSSVSGDQSLRCWRCLGDVISSALALGYHENVTVKPDVPPFLVELRTTAFARVYLHDKSFAIFLGRPPRMSKRFAHFQIPSGRRDWDAAGASGGQNTTSVGYHDWDPETHFSYRAEARWSALCASLKEEILELLFGDGGCHVGQKAIDITNRAEALWQQLPSHFRLTASLNQVDRPPFERDFLLGVRLNYLQIHFLLHLVQLDSLANPSEGLVDVAKQMLALVVEGVLSREYLVNAGSSLVWKVSQFGLPAAGVMLLAALKNRRSGEPPVLKDKSRRELYILEAEVQMGSVVPAREPNRALILTAAQTIHSVLERTSPGEVAARTNVANEQEDWQGLDDILGNLSPDPWNLEMGFWQDLAECRFLAPPGFPASLESNQIMAETGGNLSPEDV